MPINEAKDHLTFLLKKAEDEEYYFDYRLESDPRFEARTSRSKEQKKQGDVIRLEDIEP
jgi:hypothetical protein